MPRSNRNKKRKNSSEEGSGQHKSARNGGSPGNIELSESIHAANSVLYDAETDVTTELINSVFESKQCSSLSDASVNLSGHSSTKSPSVISGAPAPEPAQSPSNLDLFKYLKCMDAKINQMGKQLDKLDSLESKVCGLDGDMKKLWTFVHDQMKDNKELMSKVGERMDTCEFSLGSAHDQITQLSADKKRMQDSLLYLQSQSMRNNLIFSGITEDGRENPEATEAKVRNFMVDKLKIAQNVVDGFQLERVHSIGSSFSGAGAASRPRSTVAKFLQFKDRETVRRARVNLKGTGYFVSEQFPKEISDRRKELVPKMHQAKRDGKNAWISYDTLYIDGRPVRSEH